MSLIDRCVAHMPTAATTATDHSRGVIKEVGADHSSDEDQRSRGPTDGVHFRALGGFATNSVNMAKSYLVAGRLNATQVYAELEGYPEHKNSRWRSRTSTSSRILDVYPQGPYPWEGDSDGEE
jgi:hypothetical protein